MNFKLIPFLILIITSKVFASEIILVGEYHGKNLYVENPYSEKDQDYCVKEVYLNNSKVNLLLNTSAFEIDLSGLPVTSEVNIKIIHKSNCSPKILNPNAIKTHVKFHFNNLKIDEKKITWTTIGEKIPGKFIVEKSLHNSWTVIKELESKGGLGLNNYEIDEEHHSGHNKYRIKFQEGSEHFHYSKVIEYHSKKDPLKFAPKKVKTHITLTQHSLYEIVDENGKSYLKGKAKVIDVTSLSAGLYFLNYDNRTERFIKR